MKTTSYFFSRKYKNQHRKTLKNPYQIATFEYVETKVQTANMNFSISITENEQKKTKRK